MPESTPFKSLDELRAEHGRLLRASKEPARQTAEGAPALANDVVGFLTRARETGRVLDAPAEREAAQSVLDYWTATLFTLPSGVSALSALPSVIPGESPEAVNLQLVPFDSATLGRAATAADAWLSEQSAENRLLAQRLVLRLMRLQPEHDAYDAVPTVRAALHDLDVPDRVDAVVSALSRAGVIRVMPGESPDMERVSLRSPDLLNSWSALRTWQNYRLQFRSSAVEWDRSGRPSRELSSGEPLEDARRYHDRNKVERDYVNASAYRQARELEQAAADRRAKLWWRGLAAVAVLGWVGTGVGWLFAANSISEVRSLNRRLRENNVDLAKAKSDVEEQNAQLTLEITARLKAVSDQKETQSRLDALNRGKLRWQAAMQLSRALGEVIASRTRPERELATTRLELVINQIEATGVIHLPTNAKAVLAEASKTKDWERASGGSNKLAIGILEICKQLRNEAIADRDMNAYAVEVRKVPYQMVIKSTETILNQLKRNEPLDRTTIFVREFWTLYWGEMVMFEKTGVESAMVNFGNVLRRIEDKQKFAVSNAELRVALGSLVANPAKMEQLVKELHVRGGDSEVLTGLVQNTQKAKYTDADVADLIEVQAALVKSIHSELRSNTIDFNTAKEGPLKR